MQPSSEAVPQARTRLILCVDDDPVQQRLLTRIFEKQGFFVRCASKPAEAVDYLINAPISLIVVDQLLRGVTGAELGARFKALKPKVPVLLRSGANPETMLNVDAFIYKGEPVRELLALACDLIRRFAS